MKDRKWDVLILLGTAVLAILVTILESSSLFPDSQIFRLERPGAGQGSKQVELLLQAEGLPEDYSYPLAVEEQRFTDTQAAEVIQKAKMELEQVILGENPSAEEVSLPLVLPEELQDRAVTVSITFSPSDRIDSEGNIRWQFSEEEDPLVKVSARLQCQEVEELYEFYLRLVPPAQTEKDSLMGAAEQYFRKENEKRDTDELLLPQQLAGREVRWTLPKERIGVKLFLVGFIAVTLHIVWRRQKEEKRKKDRESGLQRDYPEIVSQLSLLLGAGMTMGMAWNRVTEDYLRKRRGKQIEFRFGYEEMVKTANELKDGVGEQRAYENFGNRSNQDQYRKLASILIQNTKKGSQGIQILLDREAKEAFLQRKLYARQRGEEAGTKLMIPMGILLVLVFAILLIPAMMSLNF